jgi:Cu+-exporting ATPase
MNQIDWQVEGMDCSNCAISIRKFLEKKGMETVSVNSIDGKVLFNNVPNLPLSELKSGIESLGYQVVSENKTNTETKQKWLHNNKQRFLFTVPFTAVLMLHMFHLWLPVHWLNNPWLQLILCLPVFILGMKYFGKSGLNSLLNGVPNMNVLVALGALVSFVYSFVGAFILHDNQYLFFETTASIITLVFLGNYLEESSMQATQKSLKSLTKAQKIMVNMIAFDGDHQELIFPIENTQLKTGDLILIKTGEQVPIDCKILWGDCAVDESIITGESLPISKTKKDFLIGGSLLEEGSVKAIVTATGNETVLSGIVKMVQQAQSEKPPMQKLADRISAIFVPTVICIAIVVFFINFFFVHVALNDAIMRAIAVLVISCPCAMGLATPAAISVGLGRAAKKGIIYRNASTLELFKSIRQIVFDKTGTLTTGKFAIQQFETIIYEKEFMSIVFSMEKYSTHPIAQSIVNAWSKSTLIRWKQIEEIKGIGIKAVDDQNNVYEIGSKKILPESVISDAHHLYLLKNKAIIGWIDVMDEIRPEAKNVIEWFNAHDIETIMLTGDLHEKANAVAKALNIKHVYSEQSPLQKMQQIERLSLLKPTAMVGDGINDAPALAKSTIGISIGNASQLALQQADVVLINQGLSHLPEAMGLGKHTYLTIKQNLFWAFAYNIIAIPIAAVGLLTPTFSALAMGFSDVMLAIISLNLFVKKVI